MKKVNFTEQEIATIVKNFSPKLNVRVNKSGNITVTKANEDGKVFWVLYYVDENRYLWRRHIKRKYGTYCHPLNMIGRKRIGEIHRGIYSGKVFTWYDRTWDIRNCEFNNVNDAVKYFVKYFAKYQNIKID